MQVVIYRARALFKVQGRPSVAFRVLFCITYPYPQHTEEGEGNPSTLHSTLNQKIALAPVQCNGKGEREQNGESRVRYRLLVCTVSCSTDVALVAYSLYAFGKLKTDKNEWCLLYCLYLAPLRFQRNRSSPFNSKPSHLQYA
jgi:hypothetical protein